MFGEIAPRYDLLNHLLSAGLDVLWRRATVRAALDELAPRGHGLPHAPGDGELVTPRRPPAGGRGYRVLDLCAGTLDLSCALSDSRRFDGRAVALDFSLPMLRRGRRKLGGRRARQILPVCADGLQLPLRNRSCDAVMVAFGLRNLEDLERGLSEVHRVLAAGGKLYVLEFSRPENALFRGFQRLYNGNVLPAIGGAVSGHPDAYRYLPDSIAEFPDAPGLVRMLEESGFADVQFRTFSGGMVALHEGRKDPLLRHHEPLPDQDDPLPRQDEPLPHRDEPLPRQDEPLPRQDEPLPRHDEPLPRNPDSEG
jgi:demethylmenaquinone methyltransferase/2-methoxy-6-polyprenyl-1,4-benzoquinol methylase